MPNKKTKRPTRIKRVALLLESGMAFDRAIACGIGDYIRSRSRWVILMDPAMEVTVEILRNWEPDGIITSIHLPTINEIACLNNIPKVGFGSYSKEQDGHLKFPIVTSNQEKIGRVAAQYFINKGLNHFAFCGGDETAPWCLQRCEGFVEELAKLGYHCKIYKPDFQSPGNMQDAINSLGNWLQSLPKPTGIFVFFDGWAHWVLNACVTRKIQVPQEVSVLGVDNDRWLCELAQPELSSIDANIRNAGYTGAEILDNLMAGIPPATKLSFIDPADVVARDSTNYMAFDDPEVAFAIRYIQEHACDPLSTADVLKVTGMSNSTAYRKFMKSIGRSPHNEIRRIQINRVKELLTSTNLTVNAIAKRSGFVNVRYLTQAFRNITGQTPTEFRRTQSTSKVL